MVFSCGIPENLKAGMRNNYKISVLNWRVKCELMSLGIEVFDVSFEATNILNYYNVCNHHYLCKENSESREVFGQVGSQVVSALLSYICQSYC